MLCKLKSLSRQWLEAIIVHASFVSSSEGSLPFILADVPWFASHCFIYLVCFFGSYKWEIKANYIILDRNRSWWPIWLKDSSATFQTPQRTVVQSQMLPPSLYSFSLLAGVQTRIVFWWLSQLPQNSHFLSVLSPNIFLALWIYFSISSSKGYGLIQTHVSQKQHRESSVCCDVNTFSREAKLYLLNVAWRFQGIIRVLNAYYHMHGISPFHSIKPLWMYI